MLSKTEKFFFATLLAFFVVTIVVVPSAEAYGCYEDYCWTWCGTKGSGSWCYSTKGKKDDEGWVGCTSNPECGENWQCGGACKPKGTA